MKIFEGDDRRGNRVRRDVNDLIRTPDGRVSEAKLCSVLGKAAFLYVFCAFADKIVPNWEVLMVFGVIFTAPDLLKKFMEMRLGTKVNP